MSYVDLKKVHHKHEDNKHNLQWYVLRYGDNRNELVMWNIFNNWVFCQYVEKHLEEDLTFEEFVEELDRELHYYFWAKYEHEIFVGCLDKNSTHSTDKIDVYQQLKPNIDVLAHYIIDTYEKEETEQ